MRLPLPLGLAAAAALVGVSLAPASSNLVRVPAHPAAPQHAGTSASVRGVVHSNYRVMAKSGKGSVYISDAGAGVVYGYSQNGGSPTYTATGFSQPQGLAATKKFLFVADTNNSQIVILQPPSTTPVGTIADPGEYPAGVAVDPKGKDVWVSNICSAPSCTKGNLSEFKKGKLKQAIQCRNLARYYFVARDSAGDVAVDGSDGFGNPHVDLIAAGTNTCTPLTSISLSFPGGLQFTTNGDLAVDDQIANTITTYAHPNFTTVVATTPLSGSSVSDPVTFAFTKGDADLWTANAGSANATEFPYPAGGTPINTISGFVQPIGVAVMPPAQVGP